MTNDEQKQASVGESLAGGNGPTRSDALSVRQRTEGTARQPWSQYFALLGYVVFTTMSLTILLELTARAVWLLDSGRDQDPNKIRAASPVYAEYSWAHDFWREEQLRTMLRRTYVPFRIWGVPRWQGKYVNNDPGEMGILRRTLNPTCTKSQTKLWVFGGSTVYGTGVPDWATLASYLSHDLNQASGTCILVLNFGVEGYVSNQELLLLTEQLKAGWHPDIVVFYDGVNDAATAQPGPDQPEPHFYYGTVKVRIEGSLAGRLDFLQESFAVRLAGAIKRSVYRKQSAPLSAEALHAKAVATLDNYEANLRVARALGKAYDFKLYWFWQPSLYYGHKPMVVFEQHSVDDAARDPWIRDMVEVYQEAERRAASDGEFVFWGGLFDSIKEPLYTDMAHLGPLGNELVAEAIANYIKDHPQP